MIDNLILFINNIQKKDHDIIIMIDVNESFSEHNSDISRILATAQTCYLIFLQHGSVSEPHTYTRGLKRINYILCTPTMS